MFSHTTIYLCSFHIVLGFHRGHNQDDGGVGGLVGKDINDKGSVLIQKAKQKEHLTTHLGHIGPASEGDRVEGLSKAS